jgi:hypothetical protein
VAQQLKYYPGPDNLCTVAVGSAFSSIGNIATFRATLWSDGGVTLNVETGAAMMQLNAGYAELYELREMLTSVLADMRSPESMQDAA